MKRNSFFKNWNSLDSDLQNFFAKRGLFIIAAVCLETIFAIKYKHTDITVFFLIISLLYTTWISFFFHKALCNSILLFEGVCESVDSGKKEITFKSRSLFEIYGKCKATMVVGITHKDGIYEEAKFVVPVPSNLNIVEGNIFKAYTLESGVFRKCENTFTITNPIIVRIIRT